MLPQDNLRKDPSKFESFVRAALSSTERGNTRQAFRNDLKVALAYSLIEQRLFAEARETINSVLADEPAHAQALWCDVHLSFFLDGMVPSSWQKLDARWASDYNKKPLGLTANWDRCSLVDKSILIIGEGGLGDQIQFARFTSALREQGARHIVVAASPKLVPLFKSLKAADEVIPKRLEGCVGTLPPHEVAVPMMSIPFLVNIAPDKFPSQVPYLSVSPSTVHAQERKIGSNSRSLNVGLFWYSPEPARDIQLEQFAPLATIEGVQLFALGENAIVSSDRAKCSFETVDLGSPEDDIISTAASMMALDLIISADTMGAHLAGALGCPVWILMQEVQDWRWPITGETTPWYPTMRIFRQQGGQWEPAIQAVAAELHKMPRTNAPIRMQD